MSPAPDSNLKTPSLLCSAVFWASLGTGLLGAIVTAVRSGGLFSSSAVIGGFLVELLMGFGLLMAVGGLVALVSLKLRPADTLRQTIGRPFSRILRIWNTTGEENEEVGRFFGWMLGQMLFFSGVFASSIYIVVRFNEPVRACALVGFVALVIFSLVRLIEKAVSSKFFSPLFGRLGALTRTIVRTFIVLLCLVVAAVAAAGVLYSHELFGAVDPSGPIVTLFFVCAMSLASNLFLPLPVFLKKPTRLVLVGAVSLLVGLIVLQIHGESLGAIAQKGVLAKTVHRGLYSALDMDGDSFPWLLGGDCHPFDARYGPFAVEIPGNGFDENCDGSDKPVVYLDYEDPLAAMDKAPPHLHRPKGNVLFIIVDAARADHTPMYGYVRNTTPAIDKFSKTATVFENTFALANHTSAAMPAILTGLYSSTFPNIAKIKWASFPLEAQFEPIQRRYNSAGYQTLMYAGHRLAGFVKGFRTINKDRSHRTSAAKLSELALMKLKAIGPTPKKPALFFIHYIDPHHSYRAPQNPYRFGKRSMDRYDAELAYVDENLQKILSLAMSKEYKDWLIVVTSDHGETFKEHGTRYHGFNLYDEEVRVPLVMRVPGAKPGRESMPVSHLDLVPTIMDWTGLEKDVHLPGQSLLPLFSDEKLGSDPWRVVFSEFFRVGTQYAAHDGRYSLIYRQVPNQFELYDKHADPFQKNNLYGKIPANKLKALLMRHVAAVAQRHKL